MQGSNNKMTIALDVGSVVKAALALVLLYALFLLRELVLVVLTAVVIASAIGPATRWFVKHKIPRLPSVVIIYLILAIALFSIFYFLVPPLLTDTSSFLATVPEYISSIAQFDSVDSLRNFGSGEFIRDFTGGSSIGEVILNLSSYLTHIPGSIFSLVSVVFGGAFSFVLIIVFSFYFSVQEKGIESFLRVVLPQKHQEYVIDLWRRAQIKIGLWMQGQLLLGLIIATLVYLGLTILGIDHALLFAILAGVFELIPLFGPVLASIPAIIVGFISGGVTLALIVAGVYIIIQQFENHLIYPLVVHKVVGVPALLVILALIIGGQLAGFLGIILAVPVAATLMEYTNDRRKRNRETMATSTRY